MTDENLRGALRAHTSDIHEKLDALTPAFADRAAYGAFTRQTFVFRAAMERQLASCTDWQAERLAPELARDLDDLGLRRPAQTMPSPHFSGLSQQLGALYVLEGSSLGARLLARRARELGLTEGFGARSLHRQTEDRERWKRFVAMLDGTPGVDVEQAKQAARTVFEFAHMVYSEPDLEPA